MPIRSVKLKMIVPRCQEHQSDRMALWTTHESVNDAVRHYENFLLMMRGRGYVSASQSITNAEAAKQSIRCARDAQKANGKPELGSDRLILDRLQRLYEAIVPSSVGKNGDAQSAAKFIGPLCDRESNGGQNIFQQLKRPRPKWMEAAAAGEDVFDEACDWLNNTAVGREWKRDPWRRPRWLELALDGDPSWPKAFVEKIAQLESDVRGAPTIIRDLKELGVLPLFPPYLAPRIVNADGALTKWDRLAFRLAVGHLISWETWCSRATKQHAVRRDRVEKFRSERLVGDLASKVKHLQRYECERTAELRDTFSGYGSKRYRIMKRAIGGWTALRKRLRDSNDRSSDCLLAIIAKEEERRRGGSGDSRLFMWLVREENQHLWSDGPDAVSALVKLNDMEAVLERSREHARMTHPDARKNPRDPQWEPKHGTNLPCYRLASDGGRLRVELPLLIPCESGGLKNVLMQFHLAPSGQLRELKISEDGKVVEYRNSSGEAFSGRLKSADLFLQREQIRNRDLSELRSGQLGSVFLKLAIDIDRNLPKDWPDQPQKAALHFMTSLCQKSKWAEYVHEGMRVLSVDLGQRNFATASVFELRGHPPERGTAFRVDDLGMWACHERSFLLTLPNETVSAKIRKRQQSAMNEVHRLRRAIARLRQTRRLETLAKRKRAAVLDSLGAAAILPFEDGILQDLRQAQELPDSAWQQAVRNGASDFRRELGLVIGEWNRRTRDRDHNGGALMGKSYWAIDYHVQCRSLRMSWSRTAGFAEDSGRPDRDTQETFGAAHLVHINNMKRDRLKAGSDLIVQAARGFLRNDCGEWEQRFAPCHVVLFEELSQYRASNDRPRSENRRLMQWQHRAVPAEVKMQGEIYGIACGATTYAAFSSRFHAATHAPGIRCRQLRSDDLDSAYFCQQIQREWPKVKLENLKAGDLVPIPGGELFVTLKEGRPTQLHADINAAQNLQRRFWTRHAEAFRLSAIKATTRDGREVWVPVRLGKLLLGALGGHGFLVPTGHVSGSCRWESVSRQKWRRLGGESDDDVSEDAALEEINALAEEARELSSELVVFFRDPSGEILPSGLWYPRPQFWGMVKARILAGMNGG